MLKLLRFVLKKLAQATIWKYRPGIIGVTGSVGKTSTKIAIASVLENSRYIRAASKNFNNEIGLPLTILGSWTSTQGIFFWPKVLFASCYGLLAPKSWCPAYPEVLILEYAADRPGDIKYLLSIAHPNISVITAIGDVPVHVEFYKGPEDVAREKSSLIEYLPAAGFAVLNRDDKAVMDLKDRTRAHLMNFGFGRGSEVRISSYEVRKDKNQPLGISFRLGYGGGSVSVKLDNVFGKAQTYAFAAAACVGLIFRMNLNQIAENLKNYKPPPGRMTLRPGIKESLVLDDSYNASPISTQAALETLCDLPAKRKIAVLGDMTEIGKYTLSAHKKIGTIASNCVDIIVTIGPRAKFIAEGAAQNKFRKKDIYQFETAEAALGSVQDLIRKGDLVLVKASRAVGLDKIVEAITIL